MRLLLVRHGQSEWNAARRLQGQADIALSDLRRAQDTAAELGIPKARLEPALREHDVGEWEGRHIPEIVAENAEAYAGWRAGSHTPQSGLPGG